MLRSDAKGLISTVCPDCRKTVHLPLLDSPYPEVGKAFNCTWCCRLLVVECVGHKYRLFTQNNSWTGWQKSGVQRFRRATPEPRIVGGHPEGHPSWNRKFAYGLLIWLDPDGNKHGIEVCYERQLTDPASRFHLIKKLRSNGARLPLDKEELKRLITNWADELARQVIKLQSQTKDAA